MSAEPDLKDIRGSLRHFQVTRNFKGLKADERAQLALNALLDVRVRADLKPDLVRRHENRP